MRERGLPEVIAGLPRHQSTIASRPQPRHVEKVGGKSFPAEVRRQKCRLRHGIVFRLPQGGVRATDVGQVHAVLGRSWGDGGLDRGPICGRAVDPDDVEHVPSGGSRRGQRYPGDSEVEGDHHDGG